MHVGWNPLKQGKHYNIVFLAFLLSNQIPGLREVHPMLSSLTCVKGSTDYLFATVDGMTKCRHCGAEVIPWHLSPYVAANHGPLDLFTCSLD